MSHELRTPLNGVVLAIELVCDGPLPEEQKEFATIARQSSLMLLDLISTVLDFSRIRDGPHETERAGIRLPHADS